MLTICLVEDHRLRIPAPVGKSHELMGTFRSDFSAAGRRSRDVGARRIHRRQSAFWLQKGIYEYSRARAGHYAKVLFREQELS